MRFLFVVDRLPYPPRDGSTIPIFNWISRLPSRHHVSLLYVKNKTAVLNNQQITENRRFAKNIWVIERSRASAYKRIDHEFDVVWAGSFSVTETVQSIHKSLDSKPIYVSGMSDSNTAVLRSQGKRLRLEGLNFKTRVAYFISWLRSWGIGRIEAKMLEMYDLILLQTDVDKKWIDNISSGKLSQKTMAVSNGVNSDLFQIPIMNEGKNILFLGTLGNGYSNSLEWLLNYVWPKIKENCKDTKLFVVGRGASKRLSMRMAEDSHICYRDYIPNICDIFKNKKIMLSPVFKGYGLINKVIESMAAGVPVIGTPDSFNGIPQLVNNLHGIVVKDADSFITEALNLLDSSIMRRKIADSARALVRNHFSWDDKIQTILEKIELTRRERNFKEY
jgi:glycosyltransferase involved in cell wall biosynthesis